jgi:hypothetical protein
MGIFDNIEQSYNSPEMIRSLALLQAAQGVMSPMAPGENLSSKLVSGLGGGLASYIKQLRDADAYNLELEQQSIQKKYRDLQMKKIEREIEQEGAAARFMDTPTTIKKLIKEQIGTEESGAPMMAEREVEEQVPYWQTLGDKGNLIRSSIVNKVSIPSDYLADKTSVKVGDQDVEMTTKDLIKYMLGMKSAEYKENKKTVRSRGYGEEGVYDYQGNVVETRKVPVKPTTGGSKGKTQVKSDVNSYLERLYSDNGTKKKRFTAEQQAAFNQISRDAVSRANAGMSAEEAVNASLKDYHTKRAKNKPAAASAVAKPKVIKTPNGTAEIVE